MSYVDELVAAYAKFVALPWQQNLAPPQRVWMAIYPPEHERRLRLHIPAFKAVTNEHGHSWALIDMTTSFEQWMAHHDYREAYFEDPELLQTALPAFFDHLVDEVRIQLTEHSDPDGVVGLLGTGTLAAGKVHEHVARGRRRGLGDRRPAPFQRSGRAEPQGDVEPEPADRATDTTVGPAQLGDDRVDQLIAVHSVEWQRATQLLVRTQQRLCHKGSRKRRPQRPAQSRLLSQNVGARRIGQDDLHCIRKHAVQTGCGGPRRDGGTGRQAPSGSGQLLSRRRGVGR